MPRVSLGHYLVGVEGLALLRGFFRSDVDAAGTRVDELADMLARGAAGPLGWEIDVATEAPVAGYDRWASSYDALPNPLIRLEEPVVHAVIDRAPAGVALDAACGTGRHSAHLAARGHRVLGVERSPGMLARAQARVPSGRFLRGDLGSLPVADASVDLAVCALALTHCADLAPPLRELARVLRPGGRLVVSDFHPFQLLIGGSAFFLDAHGRAGDVPSYHHSHARYLAAFEAAGLRVERCSEPCDGEAEVALKMGGLFDVAPAACRAALVGLPGAIVWELVRS